MATKSDPVWQSPIQLGGMVRDLSELGWLHKQIIKHSDKTGTVGKSLKLGVS